MILIRAYERIRKCSEAGQKSGEREWSSERTESGSRIPFSPNTPKMPEHSQISVDRDLVWSHDTPPGVKRHQLLKGC